jgi:isoamylase
VLALRAQRSRAMLCTLLLSFGVPMLVGGDELGRSQRGNNNAYCQDNELSWVDWAAADISLLSFVQELVALRRSHPVFRRHRYLTGTEAAKLGWFTPAGTPMTQANWEDGNALGLGVYLDGSTAPDIAADGSLMVDDDFLVLVNAWWEPLQFTIPDTRPGLAWRAEIDSFDPGTVPSAPRRRAGDRVTAGPRSVLVLRGPRVQA